MLKVCAKMMDQNFDQLSSD